MARKLTKTQNDNLVATLTMIVEYDVVDVEYALENAKEVVDIARSGGWPKVAKFKFIKATEIDLF